MKIMNRNILLLLFMYVVSIGSQAQNYYTNGPQWVSKSEEVKTSVKRRYN